MIKHDEGVFYSTQPIEYAKVYKILVSAALRHAQGKENIPLKLLDINSIKRIKPLNIKAALFVLKSACTLGLFGSKIINVTYRGYSVGRHSSPSAYRDPSSYKNPLKYYFRLAKILYKTCDHVDSIFPFIRNIKAAYVDHGCYSNGVLYEFFSEYAIPVYHDAYPYNLMRWNPGCFMKYEDSILIPKKSSPELKKFGKDFLEEILRNTEKIPYMGSSYEQMPEVSLKFDYIVYAHSFTDAQICYGYDNGFLNVFDWLVFTLDYLLSHGMRVCVKSHPNFFVPDDLSDVSRWDKNIFFEIKEKYKSYKNLNIIDYPLRNYELLESVNKSTVLISHHGNALLEGAALGFKCISSSAASWKNYNLFNTWYNILGYKKLLSTAHSDLSATSYDDLYAFCGVLYDQATTIYGDKNIGKKLSGIVGKTLQEFVKSPYIIEDMTDDEVLKAISEVYSSISEMQ